MSLISDRLGGSRGATQEAEAALVAELRWNWRTAFREETAAWDAWCAGESGHERFAAALDREQAAATALAAMVADRADA